MGAYLSEPITTKISSDESGENVAFGASSMQGWRVSQEDAHNCCISFDMNTSLFAVYDGHGGHEVATYCSQNLPDFIKSTKSYKEGDVFQALIEAFLSFDATLATPETIATLKKIAASSLPEKEQNDSCDSSEEDSIMDLRKEAEMSLEQVMLKYQTETDKSHRGVASPYLRCRRSKPGCSSGTSAGCSTSSTNESDVSSSSSTTADASDVKSPDENDKKSEPGSSDSDQLLDSTSNGDGSHPVVKAIVKSDMPDSSDDATEKIDSKISSNSEINGDDKKSLVPDSSKTDNVSSSCNSCGNGDADDIEGISSSSKKAIGEHIYRALLQRAVEDGDDSDSDDEEDETFKEGVEGNDEATSDDEDEDEDDVEDEESDVDEEDEIDEDGEFNITEEPGADSGCTAVVAILRGNELFVANAGDSRCVLCRNGEAMEMSLDHKPEDPPEMARIVKAGGKVTSDGRVNGGLNLSRALGDHAYKQNTALPADEQMISAKPDVTRVTIDPETDEFMILACDGIWNFMSSDDVVKFVRERLRNSGENISKICEELFDHCLATDTMGDGTGCDNMTAVIVKFKKPSPAESQNNGDSDQVPVTKKRPLSTENSEENPEESVNNDKPIDECKRAKMEAV
ncbi:probable protein phosphatase CG10417 [Diachasmimorpha longicaudata]|uniref:probable protein phosphatase CG10417 n=1 Tax=Diachasmimorpha longicaudata TaxID=58733 RepID=UPI0030B90DBB